MTQNPENAWAHGKLVRYEQEAFDNCDGDDDVTLACLEAGFPEWGRESSLHYSYPDLRLPVPARI
jgi:hypothetical protein